MYRKNLFITVAILLTASTCVYAQEQEVLVEDVSTTTVAETVVEEVPEITATTTESISNTIATSTATTTLDSSATTTEMATSTATSTSEFSQGSSSAVATSTPQDGPEILSGQSIALANILNLINTNFINSSGVMLFSNYFDLVRDTIDFRNYYDNDVGGACGDAPCTIGDELSVHVNSNASIDNELILRATSGENTVINGGDSTIRTGNAYAGLNLINVANTNFIDSEYLLVTMNAFSGVNGDIVFPSLKELFSSLSSGASPLSSLDLRNNATVENNVNVQTSSGANDIANAATSTIETGDTHSSSNVFNQINTSLVGDRSVSIIFKVHGKWLGEVFGAPEGLSWTHSPDGNISLFDTTESLATSTQGEQSITASSTALIKNNVSIIALTGDNEIDGADTALISTGNAYAGANIVNIANGNVVGRNWILAIINIFSDFNGNIAFGRPDLWVGEQVEVGSKVADGESLNYKFTVLNNGDSIASNVKLTDDYDSPYLEIVESSNSYTIDNDGKLVWDLPNLEPGEGTEITYRAIIRNAGEGANITNTIRVVGHETDDNLEDNTDTATVRTDIRIRASNSRAGLGDRSRPIMQSLQALGITVARKDFSQVIADFRDHAKQELVIKNNSWQSSVPVVLHDILRDSHNKVIRDEIWDLGIIFPHEEITISYDMEFGEMAESGLYTLSTTLAGADGKNTQFENNGFITILDAVHSVAELKNTEKAVEESPLASLGILTPEVAYGATGGTLVATAVASGFPIPKLLTLILSGSTVLLSLLSRYFRIGLD